MKLRPLKMSAPATMPRLQPALMPAQPALAALFTRVSLRRQAELAAPMIKPNQTQKSK